jgi:CheY-like chemotaxis protein
MTQNLRIAIADDEPDMREFLARMLPRYGHTVVAVAENGAQLVEYCLRELPDLVITDIKMPVLGGIEAIIQITVNRAVAVILVTADDAASIAVEVEQEIVCGYLIKPIRAADLHPAIAKAMTHFCKMEKSIERREGR